MNLVTERRCRECSKEESTRYLGTQNRFGWHALAIQKRVLQETTFNPRHYALFKQVRFLWAFLAAHRTGDIQRLKSNKILKPFFTCLSPPCMCAIQFGTWAQNLTLIPTRFLLVKVERFIYIPIFLSNFLVILRPGVILKPLPWRWSCQQATEKSQEQSPWRALFRFYQSINRHSEDAVT